MPEAKLGRAAFDAVLRRAGIVLTEAKAQELYAAYGTLEMLCDRLYVPPLPPQAEPATIVTNEPP